jgi:hypothetical protein
VTAISAEIDRLKQRKTRIENAQKRVKEYLLDNMRACEITRIHGPGFTIRRQANPPSCSAIDVFLTPSEFIEERVEIGYNQRGILNNLKQGKKVEGWDLNPPTEHIRIG